MRNYQRSYRLIQQSPLIHFQHYEHKATLRASEVKPKLDRFLVNLLGGSEKLCREHPTWVDKRFWEMSSSKTVSIYYKMKIKAIMPMSRTHVTETTLYSMIGRSKKIQQLNGFYFGNKPIGKTATDRKMSVITRYQEQISNIGGVELTITCFVPELLELIEQYLPMFFLLHNFGARKHFGFGSFLVEGTDVLQEMKRIKACTGQDFFYIKPIQGSTGVQKLEEIEMIARMLKGGINTKSGDYFRGFIFRYFWAMGIGNEKAFIKQNENMLASFYQEEKKDFEKPTEYRYVRAMLGLGDRFFHPKTNLTVRSKMEKGTISLFEMPLTYKIAEDYILIIPHTIPKEMYDVPFVFSVNGNEEILYTPTEEQFNLLEFLRAFMRDFNDKESEKGGTVSLKTAHEKVFRRLGADDYLIKEGSELE